MDPTSSAARLEEFWSVEGPLFNIDRSFDAVVVSDVRRNGLDAS